MELKQLESYVAVVEYGSFTKAAEKLFISQPTISTHIQMLEMELHTKLLNRHTKSIKVTERGKELYECASDILGIRDRLLKSWSDEEKKTIHLGSSTIPSTYILPELLSNYKKKYPDVQFIIHQGDSQEILDGLYSGNYQVGFIGMDVCQDDISCTPFYKDRLILVTPNTEEYAKLKEKYNETQDMEILKDILKNGSVLSRERGSGSKKYADRVLEQLGINDIDLNVIARLNDSEAIKNMVAGGLGVSLISEKAVKDYEERGKIITFELCCTGAERNLNIVYRRKGICRPYENLFVEYVSNYYNISEE
ncbi:MAG: LysR family transcriptional regulator [Lachnospiraceae bacterium]|nr:LysR family transcriptional regulator [Lachnospiraceae bacterium]